MFSYGIIGFPQPPENWNLARGAGSQAVRQICVVVLSLTRSVSFYGSINWNLTNSLSLRASSQTGVAISRIEAPFLNHSPKDSGK